MSARMTTGNSSPLALCTVIRRTPSLPSSSTGASADVAPIRGLAQRVDEAAERDAAVGLVLPRELHDLQHVREHALAGGTHDEAHVRARVLEQTPDGLRRGTMIAAAREAF